MSKYEPLERYLRECGRPWVRLTLTEIEGILGDTLPRSARAWMSDKEGARWWRNENPETTTHVQCLAWMRAGYEAKPDYKDRCVIFIRRPAQS